MAQPKILFYKGTSAPASSTHGIGTLWFDKATRVLKVRVAVAGTDSDWEQYAGKIDDITFQTQGDKAGYLIINKVVGDPIELNLNDLASAGQVAQALANLDAKISANDTAIKANTAAIGNEKNRAKGEEARIEGKVDANTTAIGNEASAREAADNVLGGRIDSEVAAREAADTELDGRIDTLESQITSLNGTLHFLGVLGSDGFNELPESPAVGDFYVAADGSEHIWTGSKWEKLGDTSAEAGRISALEGRMDTAEDDIDAVEGRMTTAEGKIVTLEQGFAGLGNSYYNKTEVDAIKGNLEGQITSNDSDILALQNRAKDIEDAASELSQKVTANENAIKTKAAQSDLEDAVADIEKNKTDIASLNTSTSNNAQAIADEESARKAADQTLQDNINTVDGKVATEKERAEAAEGALDTKIEGVSDRVTAIENTELPGVKNRIKAIEDLKITETYATKTALKAEEDARVAADNALDARVAACESALTWSGFEG